MAADGGCDLTRSRPQSSRRWTNAQSLDPVSLPCAHNPLRSWSQHEHPAHSSHWTYPTTSLAAKGLIVIVASRKNRFVPGAPLYTDYNLKASGEYVALLTPDATAATEFAATFPAQFPDISY